MPFLSLEELKKTMGEVLEKYGVPPKDAGIVSDHFAVAELWGRSSHGALRLPILIRGIKTGTINPRAEPKLVKETLAAALIDGDYGIGQVVSIRAMDLAIEKARSVGVGLISVRKTSHIGMLGYYVDYAARKGMISLAFTNAEPSVAPFGGAEPIFGTNPIAVGIPSRDEPIILDMATSVVARGRIIEALKAGKGIPKGWALDKTGKETEDPKEALEGVLLPIAGPKGYGLAMIVDILSGALSGASVGRDVTGTTFQIDRYPTKGDLFIAIDPEALVGKEEFLDRVERLKEQIRRCRPAVGFNRVLLPGEPEFIKRGEHLARGIRIEDKVWEEILALK